jgi:hypothetical protein
MKFLKTDIFNDSYQKSDNDAKRQKQYITNYVNGSLNSNINFMTPVSNKEIFLNQL